MKEKPGQPENPLIGQIIVDGLVEIDEGEYLQTIKQMVAEENPQTDEDKLALVNAIPKRLLKDAITARHVEQNTSNEVEYAYETHLAQMSQIIKGGYGVCRHFNTVSLLAAEELDMPFGIIGNPYVKHTFGCGKSEGQWKVVDPFAEVYQSNNGKPGQIFPDYWYESKGQLIVFARTSTVHHA